MLKYFYRVVEKEPCVHVYIDRDVLQYCSENTDGVISILKEIDPMDTVKSGIGWGYGGVGPHALTNLLIMELTKDKFSSLTDAEHYSYHKPILEFISNIDVNSEFRISLETLQEICPKDKIAND